MASQRLSDLFTRYLEKTITGPEKQELAELSLMAENQDEIQQYIGDAWDRNIVFEDMPADSADLILSKILKPKKVIRSIWLRRAAVAAVFIGAIGAVTVLVLKKNKETIQKETAKTVNIAPGGNRATLTLGNGVSMILDSESVGALAHQGNTTIAKTGSGSLTYTPDNEKPAEVVYNTLRTPRGGQYQITLPDGTKVWLNAASSLTYPSAFSGSQRLVKMTGEVYFEVVHNAKLPFVVLTGDQTIEDIGTAFNVNAYSDEAVVSTTLVQGSVKITAGQQKNILVPGQQEKVQNNVVRIENQVDINKVIAWKQGLFEFNQTTLPAIMRQISRWYDVDIKYDGPVSNETFGGGISRNLPLFDVLKLLEANGVQFRLENKTLFVRQTQNQN